MKWLSKISWEKRALLTASCIALVFLSVFFIPVYFSGRALEKHNGEAFEAWCKLTGNKQELTFEEWKAARIYIRCSTR